MHEKNILNDLEIISIFFSIKNWILNKNITNSMNENFLKSLLLYFINDLAQ